MTEETANKEEVKESKLNEEEMQKIVNAVASDIVKTTNLFQAFELVKEKAFNWALDHVSNQMPEEEKLEILSKVLEFESKKPESEETETANPEAGATLG
mgnify:CR=1 FL=1